MQAGKPYTYADAGFNGFMARSLKSNANAQTLADQPSAPAANMINFDRLNTSGSIADNLRVGRRLDLQGNDGRIAVKDTQGNEVGWIGDLDI